MELICIKNIIISELTEKREDLRNVEKTLASIKVILSDCKSAEDKTKKENTISSKHIIINHIECSILK